MEIQENERGEDLLLFLFVIIGMSIGAFAAKSHHERELLKDEELIERYAEGDLKSFQILYGRHRIPVFNFILRFVGSREVAEELMQEVFARLVQNATGYVRQAKFTTWLYTIARNLCIDRYRRAKHRQEKSIDQPIGSNSEDDERSLGGLLVDPSREGDGEVQVFRQQIKKVLAQAVQVMPEEQREVYLLREISGLSYKDIAEQVSVVENTVKSRMRYALQFLRKYFEKEGFSLQDVA